MSAISALGAAGLGMLQAADQRLARSADAFTRSAAAAAPDGVVDAAVGVIYARSDFQIGVKLIEVGRDTEQSLLDVLA